VRLELPLLDKTVNNAPFLLLFSLFCSLSGRNVRGLSLFYRESGDKPNSETGIVGRHIYQGGR